MAKILVNYEVLASKSESLKSISNNISSLTEEMKAEINRLKNAWQGEAAETLVNKFMSLSQTFQERYDTVNQYAEFLRKASEEMKLVEQNAKQGAEAQAGKA